MKSLLKDLNPGDEFEYVNTKPAYRVGKFLVLGDDDSYLRPVAIATCRFLFSYVTKKVVRHYEEQEVIKKENNMKTENKMGHFVGWKFGVPVRIFLHGRRVKEYCRLTHESDVSFRAVNDGGGGTYYLKLDGYTYELIPHRYGGNKNGPRYPICETPEYTSFCNPGNRMTTLDSYGGKMELYPAATPIIDGKTIELSAETTANIKAELGI